MKTVKKMKVSVLTAVMFARSTWTRMCYTCSNLKLNQSCPSDAHPKNVSDIYSCVLWRTRNEGKGDSQPKVLRQTYLYHSECSNTEFWKDFMKRRYEVEGEMNCCLTDLCNSVKDSLTNVSAAVPLIPGTDADRVQACSKTTFVSGPEALVPEQFIALAEEEAKSTAALSAKAENQTGPNVTVSQNKTVNNQTSQTPANSTSQVEEEPAYRLNSVQLIIGDEEKIFEFVTAPPTTQTVVTTGPSINQTAGQPGAVLKNVNLQTNITDSGVSSPPVNPPVNLTTTENQTTEILVPDKPKILVFFLKFVNGSANNSVVIRMLDGNLDTNRMYSVRIEQPRKETNTTVTVSSVIGNGSGESSSNPLFIDTIPSLKVGTYTGFWLRKENKTLELGQFNPLINNTLEKPLISWVDSTVHIDVQYVGFTGGGAGVAVQYGCNISQLVGEEETPNPNQTTSGLVKLAGDRG